MTPQTPPAAPRLDFREPTRLDPAEAADLTATAELEGQLLQNVDLGSPDLSGGRLVESVLEAVTLSEPDMTGTTVAESRVERFSGVHLQAARSTWRDVRMIGSRWGVEAQKVVGLEHLRGSTISTAQLAYFAPALADHLGITVLD